MDWKNPPADAPKVDELAFSSPQSTLVGDPTAAPRSYPLMAAVEQKPVPGVANTRGTTRIVVVGDSFFLGNQHIEAAANRDFAGYAANWLLDRTVLLEGIGPRPVTEYRLTHDARAAGTSPLAAARRAARRRAGVRLAGLAGAQKIMNTKNTLVWFVVAAVLFASIMFVEPLPAPAGRFNATTSCPACNRPQ